MYHEQQEQELKRRYLQKLHRHYCNIMAGLCNPAAAAWKRVPTDNLFYNNVKNAFLHCRLSKLLFKVTYQWLLLLKKFIRLCGTVKKSLLTPVLPLSHESEDSGIWKMYTDVPFQQSSGKFSSIPSLNPRSALPPVSLVKYSLTLYRSKSQQSMGMMLPRALASSAFLSPASTPGKPRDSRGMAVCKVRSSCCQRASAGFSDRVSRSVTTLWHLPVRKVAV